MTFSKVRGAAVFVQDTALYDSTGLLHADIDTLSGGFNSGHLDPIGYKGELGNYTDLETQQAVAGLYTALSGPGGASYYDPLTGVGMARDKADSANEYSDNLNSIEPALHNAFVDVTGLLPGPVGPVGAALTVSGPANGGGTTTTTTYFKYDGRGNRTATIDCLGNETDTAFNLADQMTSTLYPATMQTGSGRSQTSIAYEYTGGPADTLSVYDEGATTGPVRQTTYTYGPEGELLKTSDLLGPLMAYQYDGLYRTTAVQDGQNLQNGQSKATLYSYDLIGNLAQMLYPLSSGTGPGAFDTTTYTYDNDSNLMTRTDGNNAVTTYVRDQAVDSRLTGVNYPSGSNTPNITLGYDAFERLSSLSNSAVAKTYAYDDVDEMLNATVSFTGGPQSQAMTYGYAPDGSRTSLATPLGSYSYQYDGLGQLTRAGFPWTGGYVNHTYVKNATTGAVRTGWLGTTQTPRGLTSYNYNALGQIIGLSNQWANYPNAPGSQTTGSLYSPLVHDALGNKTNEPANIPAVGYAPDISHTLSYGYDTRDEMTGEMSAQAGGGSGGTSVYGDLFSYDLSYNPTSFKGTSVTENADNQFSLSGYIFDGNGNPTTYSGKNLAFDIEDRLVAITSPAFSATYAPDDRRTSKTANGTTTYYLYDEDGGASPLLEEQGSGTVSMGYGMAGDGLRARYAPQSGGLYYLFQWDPQGSLVQRQTGGTGGAANTSYYALDTAMFDGYGAKLGDTDAFTGGSEPTRDAMGFQGQFGAYTDNETGLVLMGHRYYDAGTGRFLTRDPKGYGGGINLYGFTGNNPVNESDPSGFHPIPGPYTGPGIDWTKVGAAISRAYIKFATAYGKSVQRDIAVRAWQNGALEPKQFPNLEPGDPVKPINASTLEERAGKWVEVRPDGEVRTASGQYIFVRKGGKLLGAPARYSTNNNAIGHIDLSKGENVDYAGQMRFTKKGILDHWDNNSGHYRPDPNYADQAGLPLDKFVPFK